jgi:hypothetical protein
MPARTTLTDAWPLFGLRLRSERLVLRLPTDDELVDLMALARAGVHPPDEMPFGVAWSTLSSPTSSAALQHYGASARRSPERWFLNSWWNGTHRGAVADAERLAIHRTIGRARLDSRTRTRFGRGVAAGFAFDGLGALVAESAAFVDNAASNAVSRSLGYEENGFGSLAPQGVARVTQRFRMTADGWRSRPRPPLVIEGLDACREMFGL